MRHIWHAVDRAFGDPTVARQRLRRRWSVLLYALLAVAGFLLALYCLPSSSWNSFPGYSEDGTIFLDDAFHHSLPDALAIRYAGYGHVLPRLVAWVTTAIVPIDVIPLVTALISAAFTSAIGLIAFRFSALHLRTYWARGIVWALIVAAPVASLEVALSTANYSWYLIVAAFWVSFGRRTDVASTVTTTLVLGLAAACTPVALLFVPVVLYRAIRWRTVHDWVPALGFLAGAVFQISMAVGGGRPFSGIFQPLDFASSYVEQVVGIGWVGPAVATAAHSGEQPVYVIAVSIIFLAMCVGAWLIRRSYPLAVTAIIASVFFFFATYISSWAGMMPAGFFLGGGIGIRYSTPSIMLLAGAIAAYLEAAFRQPRRVWRLVAVVAIALQLFAVVSGYRFVDLRGSDLPWAERLEAARLACAHPGIDEAFLIGSAEDLRDMATLTVPCERLRL